ncbi:hypothetical protein CBM2637_A70108 [Cupriavidus taiwanensis]|nr:hypothetical protein CBM2637_A70108 [Cupriavidus taiwanensis]
MAAMQPNAVDDSKPGIHGALNDRGF